jgi:hypothetical protein
MKAERPKPSGESQSTFCVFVIKFFWRQNLMLKYLLICTTMIGFLGSNLSAQDAAKKAGRGDPETAMVNQFLKQLEPAGLSQETTTKIKENFTKTAKEVMAKRKAVNLTPQMLKDRAEASKKAREDGKKPKEVREIALAAMKANEEQKKVLVETEEMLTKTRIEIGKLLTEEQMGKLPKQFQVNLKEAPTKKNSKS